MSEYQRIFVVARTIQSCRKAIHYGVSLAQKYEAELYVIHCMHNPFAIRGWSLGTKKFAEEYAESIVDAKQKLSVLVEAERTQGMSIKELVREGEPTEEILKNHQGGKN